jgi:hypothetical protein
MKNYIGTKIIKAEPMNLFDFTRNIKKEFISSDEHENKEGYMVIYDNDYQSWSPKEVFESAYREITEKEMNLIKG